MRDRTMAGQPVPGSDSSGLSDKASPKGSSLSATSMSSALNYSPSSRPGMSYSTGGFLYRKNSLPTSSLIVGNGSSSPAYGSSIYSVNLCNDPTSSVQSNSVSYNDWYKTRTSGSMTDLRQGTASPVLTRYDDVLKCSSLTASNDSISQEFSNMRVSPKSSTESFLDFSKPVKSAWTSDSVYNTSYSNRSYSPSWTSYSTTIPKTFTGLRSATPSPVHDPGKSVFTRSLSSPVDFTTNSHSSVTARPTSFLPSSYSVKTSPVNNKQYDILPGRPVSPDIVVTPDENLTKSTFLENKSNLYRSKSEKDTLKNFKTISPRSEALKSTTKLRKYLKNDSNSIDLKEPSIELDIQRSPVAALIAETNSCLSRSRSMSPTPLKAFQFQSMFESSEVNTNPDIVSKTSDASQPNFSVPCSQEDVPNTLLTPENDYCEKKKPSSEPANVSWKQKRVTPTSSKSSSATELKKSGSFPSYLNTYSNYSSTGEQRTAFDDIPSNNLTETPRGRTGSVGSKSTPKIHIPSFEEYKRMRKLSELKIKIASPRASLNDSIDKKSKEISSDKANSELDEEVSKAFASESNNNTDVNSKNKVSQRKSKEGSKNSSGKSKPEEEQIKKSNERQSREDSRKSGFSRDKRSASKSRLQRRDPVERSKSPFLIRKTVTNQQDNEKGRRDRKRSEKDEQGEYRKTEENKEELRRTKSKEENQTEAGPKRLERRHRRPASDKRKQSKEEGGLSRSCSDSKAVEVKKHKHWKQRLVEDGSTPRERPLPTRHSSEKEIKRKNSQGKSPRSDVSDGSLPSSGRVTPSLYVTSSLEALNEETLVQGGVARKNRKIRHRASTLSTDSGVGGTPDLEEPDRLLPGSTDIERTDSGVGSETNGRRIFSHCDSTACTTSCYDCSTFFEYQQQIILHGSEYLCEKCDGKRTTRKEAITEFVQTEVNYLEDIKVMHREFYVAMENAGLLTPEQLKTVFINLQELIEVSEKFTDCLQDCLENAADEDDNDFINVNIGKLFLDNLSILFPAFEAYCVNQPTGAALLKSLVSEKQLLRVFLEVSQNDNRAVRRQHLKSFLMVPVQRSMRYPLLLNRIYKSTPNWHEDRERLQEGQRRTEDFLEEVNVQSQGSSATKSTIKHHGSFYTSIPSNIKAEIRKVAVDSVSWNLETVHLIHMSQLLLGPGLEQIWQKMISTPRHVPVYAVLVCTGKVERFSEIEANLPKNGMLFPHVDADRKAAFVLVKEKTAGKCSVVREPFLLGRCIVSSESVDEFTLTEMEGDTIELKCENSEDCGKWLIILKHYSVQLGSWRSRRNALANIMIHHTLKS